MWKKVPDPTNPTVLVNARPIEVVSGDTKASITAILADGTKIIFTVEVAEISLIEGRNDVAGKPIYNIDVRGQVAVVPPGGATA